MVTQLIMGAQSTVDEKRLNCLRTLIELFMKKCSIVYQSRLQCSPTLGQLFKHAHSTVHDAQSTNTITDWLPPWTMDHHIYPSPPKPISPVIMGFLTSETDVNNAFLPKYNGF
jgi:hypothetical protein